MTKGPRLTKEQAKAFLERERRLFNYGGSRSRAFRVYHAFQCFVGHSVLTGLTKNSGYTISGPPTTDARRLSSWKSSYRIIAIVPCVIGFRAILKKLDVDPACWI